VNDDAVAPVIAVMLILAAAAMAFAVFNGVYIPSVKEAAEIEHLHAVETSFQQFSSDIERAVSDRKDGTALSEPVPLGGGDVFLNPLRSAGSLSIINEDIPVYYLILMTDDGMQFRNGTLVNISYTPAGNFWQDQGYRWQYGFLNVTKYGKRQVPLSYSNMTEVTSAFQKRGPLAAFAGSFGTVESSRNATHVPVYDENGNITSYGPRDGNCSAITINAVNITASPDHPFASGNGIGRLELGTRIISEEYYGVKSITIWSGMTPFGNATAGAWNKSFSALNETTCRSNILYNPDLSVEGFSTYMISQDVSPVNVTVNIVSIGIGAQ